MKLSIVILAVLGVVCGKYVPRGSLEYDLKDYVELVPSDKLTKRDISDVYRNLQEKLYEFMEIFPTHKVIEITLDYLAHDEEVREFVVYTVINEISDILGFTPFHPTNTTHRGVGFEGLIDDVIDVVPVGDLKTLFEKKMETNIYYQYLVKVIHSPEFTHIVEDMVETMRTLQTWPEYQKLLETLREKGVDVDRMYELLLTLFGRFSRETRSLQDELKEFVELFPTHKVIEITLDYLANDKEVWEFFVYKIINVISNTLRLAPFETKNTTQRGVGIRGLYDDVIAVLPIDDMKVLFDKEMETNVYLQHLYKIVHSPEFVHMLEYMDKTMRTWPEYQKLLEIIREKHIDLDLMTKLLRTLFDRSLPGALGLKDKLFEVMKIFPTHKVIEITLDYLYSDEEVREFVVYTIINEVSDILGFTPFQPTNTTHKGVGFYGLIDDVIDVVPIYDLKTLFEKKMETIIYYQYLVKVIHSPEFKHMVEEMVETMRTLQTWPEYQKLLETLREKGVDVDRMYELLLTVFGRFSRGTRSLQDDLKEFVELVPAHEIIEITLDYLAYDKEVREFLLYKIINKISDILHLTPFQPTNTSVGIRGLVDDVIAVLPIDDLKVLYDKEMESRVLFQHVFKVVHSPEFESMLDTVRAWPIYEKLLEIVREKGVDVDHINELLALFGVPHL